MTDAQAEVGTLWCELLGIHEARPEDSFVRLGGDSVAAMVCIQQLKRRHEVEVPLRVLLDDRTTLSDVAALVALSSRRS